MQQQYTAVITHADAMKHGVDITTHAAAKLESISKLDMRRLLEYHRMPKYWS